MNLSRAEEEPAVRPDAPSELLRVHQDVEQNSGVVIGIQQNFLRRLIAHHRLDAWYVDQQRRTFASPPGIERAHEVLRTNRVVVLVAEVDSGLHHAAVHLLSDFSGLRLREVIWDPESPVDLGELMLEPDTGWLLDLRDAELHRGFGRTLSDKCRDLEARSSWVVVIVTPHRWAPAAAGAEHLQHRLQRAKPADIVRARVAAAPTDLDPAPYLDDLRVQSRMQGATPAEAAMWAEAILKVGAQASEPGEESHSDGAETAAARRVDVLLELRGNWRSELISWHRSRDSRDRNFLLAAAVLEGSGVGVVFEAANDLAATLGEQLPEAAGQQGPGVFELCERIGADLDGECIRFSKPDYADGIVDFFWLDRAHLRPRFLEWLARSLRRYTDSMTAAPVATRVAGYVLRWTRRERTPKFLRQVLVEWAQRDELREAATQLALTAVLDPDLTAMMGKETLAWARGTDATLQVLLAEICGNHYGRLRSNAALYRLGILSESTEERVLAAVTKAVGGLWDAELEDAIFDAVGGWCDPGGSVHRQRAGASAFLALADQLINGSERPALLAGAATDGKYRYIAERGWRAVLDLVEDGRPEQVLGRWFDAALSSGEDAASVSAILDRAVQVDGSTGGVVQRSKRLTDLLYACQPPQIGSPAMDARTALRETLYLQVLQGIPSPVPRQLSTTAEVSSPSAPAAAEC